MKDRIIYTLQVLSLSGVWVFSLGISIWIIHLIRLSNKLQDAFTGSVAISIVAIPVFLTGATILTVVFIGLQRGKNEGHIGSTE